MGRRLRSFTVRYSPTQEEALRFVTHEHLNRLSRTHAFNNSHSLTDVCVNRPHGGKPTPILLRVVNQFRYRMRKQ